MKFNKHGMPIMEVSKKLKQTITVNKYFCKVNGCKNKADKDKLCRGYCGHCFMDILMREEK